MWRKLERDYDRGAVDLSEDGVWGGADDEEDEA